MTDKDRAAALFDGWEETLIWSALQGVMGRLEWNGDGSAGRITLGDFCFLAGKPDRALAETLEAPIVTAREEGWYRLVEEVYGPRAVRQTRYATAKDPSSFDRRRLAGFIEALPPGYVLRPMDEAMVPALLAEPWSRDFCSNFDAPADFARRGIGIAALWDGGPRGRGRFLQRVQRRHRDPDRDPGGPPPPGACKGLRGGADPGLPGPGALPQLGRPGYAEPCPGGEAGLPPGGALPGPLGGGRPVT